MAASSVHVLSGQGDACGAASGRGSAPAAQSARNAATLSGSTRRAEAIAVFPALVEDHPRDGEIEHHVAALAETDVQRARIVFLAAR